MLRRCILFIVVFYLIQMICSAEEVKSNGMLFEGIIYGYKQDPSSNFLWITNETVMEGGLESATIIVEYDDKIQYKTKSDKNGSFRLLLDFNKTYKIVIVKEKYNKAILLISTNNIPAEKYANGYKFIGAEFIINNNEKEIAKKDEIIGKLYYNESTGFMEFIANENRNLKTGFWGTKKVQDNAIELMQRAVAKNKVQSEMQKDPNKNQRLIKDKIEEVKVLMEKAKNEDAFLPEIQPDQFRLNVVSDFKLSNIKKFDEYSLANINEFKDDILDARVQLRIDKLKAKTKADSLLILSREAQILAAELQVENAIKLNNTLKIKVSLQQFLLYVSLTALLLLVILIVFIVNNFNNKQRSAKIINAKNKNILDSINYAKRIQDAILVSEDELQKHIPESFVFYKPRDIVSGDFYWFSEINDKLIVATVDCTGHGVPGAFMSLIGNTLLNRIINEDLILDPSEILKRLHKGILEGLHQNNVENLQQDGMDLSLCVIDKQEQKIAFAGAMNSIYVIYNNDLTVIKADNKSIGGKVLRPDEETLVEFTTKTLVYDKGISLYLFTDGYLDQFGGKDNTKFNTPQFKQLLLSIQDKDLTAQKEALIKAHETWIGNNRQIDDILVVGIRL